MATKTATTNRQSPQEIAEAAKMVSLSTPLVPGQLAGELRHPPAQKTWQSGFLTLKVQILFAFFFGAREDQPVLLRSRATCRLSRIFSEILQDRHRPPSDLADGLMRNSSSLGGDFKGRQPLAWQTRFLF